MDASAIKDAIIDGAFDEEELFELNRFIVDELKAARQRKARRNIHRLYPGSRATVVGHLRGDAYLHETGEVIEVKRTRVSMRFPGKPGTVTIPASVLAPADE